MFFNRKLLETSGIWECRDAKWMRGTSQTVLILCILFVWSAWYNITCLASNFILFSDNAKYHLILALFYLDGIGGRGALSLPDVKNISCDNDQIFCTVIIIIEQKIILL